MKKWYAVFLASVLSMMLFSGVASAHVTVYPKETAQGTYEKFTVRVPTEKDIPTVKVEVKIPADADISRFEPKPGWKYELSKDAAGKITSVVWTSTGEGLSPTEFGEFNMQGKVGDKASQLVWKAYQTYKDGSVVEWTGAPDAKTPASVTTVKAKPASAGADGHDHGAAEAAHDDAQGGTDSNTAFYLSIAALVISLAAFGATIMKKSK